MSVLFAVLKIIGIVILIILGICLLLILLLLFWPFSYKVKCVKDEKTDLFGCVRWLGFTIYIPFSYIDGKFFWKLRVFGINILKIRLLFSKKRTRKNKRKGKAKSNNKKSKDNSPEVKVELDKSVDDKSDRTGKKRKLGGIRKKILDIKKLLTFILKEETKAFVCIIKDNVIHLLKKLMPKKIKGTIYFGTGDPCSTGQILGLFSLVYVTYKNELKVTPDFNEKILKVNVWAKGRITLFTLIRIICRVYFSDEWKIFSKEYDALRRKKDE